MWSCDACRFRRNDISASGKLGLLPLPIWGEGWGEGVTGGTDGSEPPHPFLRVARESSPLPGGERARAAIARLRHVTASRLHAARGEHSAHAQRRAVGIGDEAGGVGEAEQLGE